MQNQNRDAVSRIPVFYDVKSIEQDKLIENRTQVIPPGKEIIRIFPGKTRGFREKLSLNTIIHADIQMFHCDCFETIMFKSEHN